MSQLPPPNFGKFPSTFNVNGFPSYPTLAQGAVPSIFGRPPCPSLSFSPRLPFNSFPRPPFCQFRPPVWPNGNFLPHHVAHQHSSLRLQRPPHSQVTSFQGKTNKAHENGQNSLATEFSCDACQKQFTSKETLNAHLGMHIQCNNEDCTFKATRKMLKLHWIQVHATEKMRIKLDTPEEIAKWREERKRKYPTLANVKKKKEEEAKKRASGQVLKTKNFRYRIGRQRGRGLSRQSGHNHFNNQGHQGKGQENVNGKEVPKNQTQNSEVLVTENKDCEEHKSLRNGSDPLSFVLGVSADEEESDTETGIQEKSKSPSATHEATPNTAPAQVSALNSLCSAYASDSDDNEEISATEINNNKETNGINYENSSKKTCSNEPDSRLNMEHKNKIRSGVNCRKTNKSSRFQRRKRKRNTKVDPKSLGVRKSTLLEKLLAPEIRHERNVILQCLRHIVKKDFFGVGETTSLTD